MSKDDESYQGLESPYLDGELFSRKDADEVSKLSLLNNESPFIQAFLPENYKCSWYQTEPDIAKDKANSEYESDAEEEPGAIAESEFGESEEFLEESFEEEAIPEYPEEEKQLQTGQTHRFLTESRELLTDLTKLIFFARYPDLEQPGGTTACRCNPKQRADRQLTEEQKQEILDIRDNLVQPELTRGSDENRLTNLVFCARHPQLQDCKIPERDKALEKEWTCIRDHCIRPPLKRTFTQWLQVVDKAVRKQFGLTGVGLTDRVSFVTQAQFAKRLPGANIPELLLKLFLNAPRPTVILKTILRLHHREDLLEEFRDERSMQNRLKELRNFIAEQIKVGSFQHGVVPPVRPQKLKTVPPSPGGIVTITPADLVTMFTAGITNLSAARSGRTVMIQMPVEVEVLVHEACHFYMDNQYRIAAEKASNRFFNGLRLSEILLEGFPEYFTRKVMQANEKNLGRLHVEAYQDYVEAAGRFITTIEDKQQGSAGKAFFFGNTAAINRLFNAIELNIKNFPLLVPGFMLDKESYGFVNGLDEEELDNYEFNETELGGEEHKEAIVAVPENEWELENETLHELMVDEEIIQPKDSRILVRNTLEVPYRWICALDLHFPDKLERGTGILIGPRHVLTVAHALVPNDGTEPVEKIIVAPARNGAEEPFGRVEAEKWDVCKNWQPPDYKSDYDYALITLKKDISSLKYRKLGNQALGYWGHLQLGQGTIIKSLEPKFLSGTSIIVNIAGYLGDKCGKEPLDPQKGCSAQLQASTQWRAFDKLKEVKPDRNLMKHTVDTYGGQSGAPVWLRYEKRRNLIGIHVGGAPDFTQASDDAPLIRVSNYAVRITDDVWSEINSWMKTDEKEPGTQEIDQLFYEFEDDEKIEEEERAENKFEDCNNLQKNRIQTVSDWARAAVTRAAAVVGSAYGRPSTMSPRTRQLLNQHFHTTDRDNLLKILKTLTRLSRAFEEGVSFQCETKCDVLKGVRPCGYAKSTQWSGGFGDVHICFDNSPGGCNFTKQSAYWQTVIIVHEVGHRYVGLHDKAYIGDPKYNRLSPKQAMNNADSYAGFSVDL